MTKAVELAQVASTGVSEAFKNRIINGAMVIDQRNAGASLTLNGSAGQYGVDRIAYNTSQASKLTAQQSTTVPVGFYNSNLVTVSSAATIGSSDYFTMFQHIEANNVSDLNFGSANAKTVTLSFWVRSSVTGTFVVGLLNASLNRAYLATYTVSSANTWEYKTVTVAGDTSGTWTTGGNGIGLTVRFDLGSGSSGMGTANAWQSSNVWSVSGSASSTFAAQSGATFYITGIQLEVGSTATSFDYRPYTTELQLCQRYAVMITGSEGDGSYIRFGSGQNYSTTACECSVFLPVKMRTYPSLTASATASLYQIYASNNGSGCNTSPILRGQGNSPLIACLSTTVASGLTTGQACSITANGTASAYLLYTAEL